MKTVREYINEARARNNDILIEVDNDTYEEMYGGGWTATGEWGWTEEEDAFDDRKVVAIEHLDEGITIIAVE